MRARTCQCPTCRAGRRPEFEEEASVGATAGESPFSEAEETELAMELLSVSSEAELDQFLGKLLKGVKSVGSAVGKIARPLSGALKGLAKKALPFVGGALGSFIPIPGVGTAVGSALGSAVSKALEAELAGLEPEDRRSKWRAASCVSPAPRPSRRRTRQRRVTHRPQCALRCSARRVVTCRISTARARAAGCAVAIRSSFSGREQAVGDQLSASAVSCQQKLDYPFGRSLTADS